MQPDFRLSPRKRFEAVINFLYGQAVKPKAKPPRRRRPPCNAWGKRH